VRDGGVAGVVIRLSPRAASARSRPGATPCAPDRRASTSAWRKRAAAANIAGLEFYFGIPGSIGGALRMNAGANGGETKDVLVEARGRPPAPATRWRSPTPT